MPRGPNRRRTRAANRTARFGCRGDGGREAVERHRVRDTRPGADRIGHRSRMGGRGVSGGVHAGDVRPPVGMVRIVPASVSSQPSAAASPFGWSRHVVTNRASRRSAGPCVNSIRSRRPSLPASRAIGSVRTRTPEAAGSMLPGSGAPSVHSTTSLLQPARTSADRTAPGPLPWNARGRSRTSQPSQNAQWNTDRPPEHLDPGKRRRVVAQPVSQHDRMRAHRRPVRRPHDESIADALDVLDGTMTDVDARMLLELPPPAVAQVRRLHAIVPEQTAHTLGHGVRRPVVIDQEHSLRGSAQHESCAQARGPAADDHCVVRHAAPGIEQMEPIGHAYLDATGSGESSLAGKSGGYPHLVNPPARGCMSGLPAPGGVPPRRRGGRAC